MATQFDAISEVHQRFIEAQHIFFVGTAAADGRVNISPKGGGGLIVAGPNRILWRNLTGSGNETAGHLRAVNRMTLMWCSFDARPLILRAYGTARCVQPDDSDWSEMNGRFAPSPGARQVYDMAVDMVQSSCGYAVPFLEYQGERDTLERWADAKGPDGMRAYWAERNTTTLDGLPTGIGAGDDA